jgi:hypothetical protein
LRSSTGKLVVLDHSVDSVVQLVKDPLLDRAVHVGADLQSRLWFSRGRGAAWRGRLRGIVGTEPRLGAWCMQRRHRDCARCKWMKTKNASVLVGSETGRCEVERRPRAHHHKHTWAEQPRRPAGLEEICIQHRVPASDMAKPHFHLHRNFLLKHFTLRLIFGSLSRNPYST